MPDPTRVLVIEDDRDILRGLAIRLRAAGFEVLTASNGAAGLKVAAGADPDAILLDIRMPGMDGIAVLGELKAGAETKSAAVVMLSANVVEQARSRALALGASCFVAKPFQMEKLITTIRDVIGLGDRTRRSDRSIAAGPDRARADAGRLKFRH